MIFVHKQRNKNNFKNISAQNITMYTYKRVNFALPTFIWFLLRVSSSAIVLSRPTTRILQIFGFIAFFRR